MNAIATSARAEWTKLWSVRSTWGCLVGAALMTAFYSVPLGLDSAQPNPELPRQSQLLYAHEAAVSGLLLTQFALLAFVLLTVTSEYAAGSIGTTLSCTPRRINVAGGKLAVASVVAGVAGALVALAGAALGHWSASGFGVFDVSEVAQVVGKVAAYMVVASGLAVGLALLVRRTAGALVGVFVLLFGLPIIFLMSGVSALTTVAYYLPGTAGSEFLSVGFATMLGLEGSVPYGSLAGLGVLAAWSATAMLVGYLAFSRRDA